MEQYLALTISTPNPSEADTLLAFLSEAGFEGFEELPDRLMPILRNTLYRIATKPWKKPIGINSGNRILNP
jgi:hypothetical protein